MSLDPVEAIEQVLERIEEGCCYGNNSVISGWLHNAPKEEIIEWVGGNIKARVVNALERTKDAMSTLKAMRDALRLLNSGARGLLALISAGGKMRDEKQFLKNILAVTDAALSAQDRQGCECAELSRIGKEAEDGE